MTEYIDAMEIANTLGLSRTYVVNVLVKKLDFPRPALNLSQKTRRWLRDDFEGWVEKQTRGARRSEQRFRDSKYPQAL